jgi:RNA ligase (TIGR02306 family)
MKLASVETIIKLDPIPNADSIELATVLGWEVVVSKDKFKIGDKCIYIPIDTLVDTYRKWFYFLSKDSSYKPIRIKTTRIRGVWSQGLIIPITEEILEEVFKQTTKKLLDIEFEDIGGLIGVTKYQKDIAQIFNTSSNGAQLIDFPTDIISKTEEPNLKTKPDLLKEFENKTLYITKKMDGSSMTLIYLNNKISICSRNYILEEDSPMYMFANNSGLVSKILANVQSNIAIQGEFCGPKINSNKLKLSDNHFYIFNIKNLDTDTYYSLNQIKQFIENLGLEMVPVLDIFEYNDSWDLKKFQEYANNIKYNNDYGEGVVIRPVEPVYSDLLRKNLSCKIINQFYKD